MYRPLTSIPSDSQCVGDPVDVVEPGGNERDLEDAPIVESHCPQPIVELGRDPGCIPGDLLGELEHHTILFGDWRRPVIALQRLHERFVKSDPTQKLCVRVESILTPIHRGHDGRNHFVLPPRQRQIGRHHRGEGGKRMIERRRNQGVRAHDTVSFLVMRVSWLGIFDGIERTLGAVGLLQLLVVVERNSPDSGHG